MESIYIGLDVHHKSTTYCIQDETGREQSLGSCPTDQAGLAKVLGPCLSEHPGALVAMESCGKAYVVSGIVARLGGKPFVVAADEAASKTRSRKKKNDTRDARDLCTNLRTGALQREVILPPPEMRHLRSLLRGRQLLVKQQVQIRNAAKALLREYGLAHAQGMLVSAQDWRRRFDQEMPEVVREILKEYREIALDLGERIEERTRAIEERLSAAPAFAVVRTIPGIGLLNQAALAAYLFDIERFAGPKRVSAYVGLCPSSYDSGETRRGGRITREGPKILRSLLVEAAQHTARPYHPLHRHYLKHLHRHGYKKTIVAMANKLCRIVYALVKNQEPFDPTAGLPPTRKTR